MNDEIFFNMYREPHPIYGKSEFLLRRWRKHTISCKSGSYVRSDNPGEISILSSSVRQLTPTTNYTVPDSPKANVYSTNSIYLYDYVIVSDTFFFNNVYTASTVDSTPAEIGSYAGGNMWSHSINTWQNSPNAIFNNYVLRYNSFASSPGARNHDVYGYDPLYPGAPDYAQLMKTPIYRDDGTYFEIVRGYPRNHYIHKRGYFALERFTNYGIVDGTVTSASYRKGMQTAGTTIGPTGLSDGSDPVQTTIVTNIDLIKSDNVIYR